MYFIFVHLSESKCHSILQRKDSNIPFFFEWPPKGIPYNRRVNANKVTKEKKKKTQNKVVETLFTFGKLFLWIFPLFKFLLLLFHFHLWFNVSPNYLRACLTTTCIQWNAHFCITKKKRKFSLCYTIYARKRWSLSKKKNRRKMAHH